MCVKSCVKENFTIFARKTSVNMSVRFTLEKRTNKYGESPIRLSWSFGGLRYQTTLGYSIKKANWDDVKKLVKTGTHNLKGQKAEDINFIIKRISLVVTGVEQHFDGNGKALTKDMMKKAVSDVLSHDFARTEDIIERCIEGIVSIARPETLYYQDLKNRYYRLLCDANYNSIKFKILQQLFGRGERIAVPSTDFKPRKIEGIKPHVLFYREVSYDEVYGR